MELANTPMTFDEIVKRTKKMLGENYREQVENDEPVNEQDTTPSIADAIELDEEEEMTDLQEICEMVIREAAQWTNRYTQRNINIDALASMMTDCWPVIVRCSCVAYLNRGAEGLGSQSELGQQNVYNDWIKLLHQQLTNRRHVI